MQRAWRRGGKLAGAPNVPAEAGQSSLKRLSFIFRVFSDISCAIPTLSLLPDVVGFNALGLASNVFGTRFVLSS
jgi:hypothetical protein